MPTPGQAQEIANLGPFALFVFLTILGVVALYRKWIVLGWIYDQERQGRLNAETQALRTAEALEATNTSVISMVKELAVVRRELRGVRDELRTALSGRVDGD